MNIQKMQDKADYYFDSHRVDECLRICTKVINSGYGDIHFYLLRADCFFALCRYEDAIKEYRIYSLLLLDDPKMLNGDEEYRHWLVDVSAKMAICYNELEQFEDTVKMYTLMMKIEKPNSELYWRRGMAYWELREYEKATNDLLKCLEFPDTYGFHKGAKEALDAIKETINKLQNTGQRSSSGRQLLEKVMDCFNSQKYKQCINICTQLIDSGRLSGGLLYSTRADAYVALEMYKEAIDDYKMIISDFFDISDYSNEDLGGFIETLEPIGLC